MIEIKNLYKSFRQPLFVNADMIIYNGRKTYIRGINGCGKSVLLKMIIGYSRPDEGTITADGYKIGIDGDFLKDAGVSINAPEFIPELTGMENLLELAAIRKKASKEDIMNLARKLYFEEDIDKQYRIFSLGMRQKMRVIQALMDRPRYVILDEIFDALDDVSKEALQKLLNDYLKENPQRYVIYTSHENQMDQFADQTFLIKDCSVVEYKEGRSTISRGE